MKSIYVQLLFLLNFKTYYYKNGFQLKSICFQFIWIYFQLIFLFNLQRNLLIRKGSNWNQFTFNSFESTFNWFYSWTSKKSINKKGFQLKPIYFQFIWIYFQVIFLLNQKKNAPKVFVHNRVPSKQLHSWGSGSLMGYPLKIVWVLFLNKGLIKHLIIWETLHFQGFNMDMAF